MVVLSGRKLSTKQKGRRDVSLPGISSMLCGDCSNARDHQFLDIIG